MLLELSIENFALIEKLQVSLGPGLNVLSGETGAGKSIIVDAVNLVLGGRASTEFIREPAEKSVVEGIFEISDLVDLFELLAELGFDFEEESILILTREISLSGRNICRVNGRITTLANYRSIAQNLIDLHGQHEHQSILHSESHLGLLDGYGGTLHLNLRQKTREIYGKLTSVERELNNWRQNQHDSEQQQSLLAYQLQEITEARLTIGEEEALLQQKRILQNTERLTQGLIQAYKLIYEGAHQQNSALDQLSATLSELQNLRDLDRQLDPVTDKLENIHYQIEDIAHEIHQYLDALNLDESGLDAVEERLGLIQDLKRKYGSSIAEILEFGQKAQAQLHCLNEEKEQEESLSKQKTLLTQEYHHIAQELGKLRRQSAEDLAVGINRNLEFLGMPNAQFTVQITQRNQIGLNGLEEVEFLLSPNPGEVLKPLARIASGGETSRIMLALKTLFANVDQIPTLIFDEIDTGIGGKSLEAVASQLSEVAKSHQVICVTHAAQIAAWADQHLFIEKEVYAGRTQTRVQRLNESEKIEEIARMLDGDIHSQVSLTHAQELLQRVKMRKEISE